MLVVQGSNLKAGHRDRWLCRRATPEQLHLRQALVKGQVPLPPVDDGQTGFGPGADPDPAVQGRPQRRPVGARRPTPRGDLPVVAVVVGDVGAGPQQNCGLSVLGQRAQDVGDDVRVGASAGAEQRRFGAVPARFSHQLVQPDQLEQVRADPVKALLARVVRQRAFIPGHTGQPQRRGRRNGPSNRHSLLHGPRASPPTVAPELDENVERAAGRIDVGAGQGGGHDVDDSGRVGPGDDPDVGIRGELFCNPAQTERGDQGVRDLNAADPEGSGYGELGEVGDGDAPGAGVELLLPQLGGHRRLAVRGQGDAVPRGPRRHRLDVGRQCRAVQGDQRCREAGESRPILQKLVDPASPQCWRPALVQQPHRFRPHPL